MHSQLKEFGGKLVQVEPRLSVSAAKSDRWLPINAGSETALALGVAHVLIKEKIYNTEFVEKYGAGFEDWTDADGKKHKGFKTIVLESFAPETVAKITGIEPDLIRALARKFGRAIRPLAICGRGQGRSPGSVHEFLAVHALNALVGNINQKGGIWAVPLAKYISWYAPYMDKTAKKGAETEPIVGKARAFFQNTQAMADEFPEAVLNRDDYPVNALFVLRSNPLYTLTNTSKVKEAFDKIPCIVSMTPYMDETAAYSDIVLPTNTYLEQFEDIPGPFGHTRPMVGFSRPVVKPEFDTRHAGDIIISMAKSMGNDIEASFPWKDFNQCFEKTFGKYLEKGLEKGYLADPDFKPASWKKAFQTPDKKFYFMSAHCNFEGKDKTFVDVKGDFGTYPLLLIPYDSLRLSNGRIGNTPFLTKTVENTMLKEKDVFVEIHPKTAKSYDLSDGCYANLITVNGEAKVRVRLYEGILPGYVAMPTGLGHTAYDKYLSGKGVNYNSLAADTKDPISGMNVAWGVRAKLMKA
jgi:anaerobic selenocysteine-containing dehydrogenase